MSKVILSVEDSPSMSHLVRDALEAGGYQVLQAFNGAQGLVKAKEHKADMVITDLNMPVMNGMDLIQELRKLPAYQTTPIVFLTTQTDHALKQKARNLGATGWLTKPFLSDQLLQIVKKLVGA
jgi:two-component system, chemotaxis family, chemotaxis protein CheY